MGNPKSFGISISFKNGKDSFAATPAYGLGVSDWDEMAGVNKFPWDSVHGSVECGTVATCHDKCIKAHGVDSVFVGKETIPDEELADDVSLVTKSVCLTLITNFEWTHTSGYSSGGIPVFCTV